MNRRLVPVILAALAVAVAAWLLLPGGERAGDGGRSGISASRDGGESGAAHPAVPAPRRAARPVGSGAASDAAAVTGAGLRVLVLDASTRYPVASAVAGLHVEDGGNWSAFAREDGTVRFDGLPGGVGRVSLNADGYIDGGAPVALVDGVEVEIEVLLHPVPRITGRVVSATTGKPVAGAEVRATDRSTSSDWLHEPPAAVTGPDGGFTASADGDGKEVRIHVRAKGYMATEVTHRHTVPGVESNRPTIPLQPAGHLRGTARDVLGRPVAGAEVTVRPEGVHAWTGPPVTGNGQLFVPINGGPGQRTRTASDGTFSVKDLEAGGVFRVEAESSSPPAWGRKERVFLPEDGSDGTVDLLLEPGGNLLVTWKLPEGEREAPPSIVVQGIAGAAVGYFASRSRGAASIGEWTGSEAEGWTVETRPGSFTVSVRVGRCRGTERADVESGRTTGVIVELALDSDGKAPIAGVVLDQEGRPMAGASVLATLATDADGASQVTVVWGDTMVQSSMVQADREGRFEFPSLEKGKAYRVRLHRGSDTVEATPPESGVRLTAVRDAILTGHAVIPADLAADGLLEYRTEIPDGQDGWKPWTGDTVGWSGGRFAAAWIPPGPVRIWLRRGGLVGGPVETTVAPGEKKDLGGIPMRAGLPLAGKVVDGDGRPVAGALMALGNSTRLAYAVSGSPVTGADGSFNLGTRPPVPWPITIEGESCVRTVVISDPATPAPLKFVVPRGGILKGRARDGDGLPAAGATVEASPAGGGAASRLLVDHLGRFEARLPAGMYQLTIHFAGASVPAGTARLEEGGTADLSLTAR